MMTGTLAGSIVLGVISDKYGRKTTFSKSLIFISIGTIIGTFSPNV